MSTTPVKSILALLLALSLVAFDFPPPDAQLNTLLQAVTKVILKKIFLCASPSLIGMSEIEKKPSKAWTITKDLLAGTVGGWTQVLVAQPFDTVKVRSLAC